ncbi:hypothetical protein SAY87_023398 [Trapa incisa]|uniref:peptidyl-tRNA hydrolase n=1 Tax=Trapa incisa TaxID=236973 RepID=A0AAN7KXP2_9MYRT|nr:hypothetical protein SAY87_023398 [Trapa incisa]
MAKETSVGNACKKNKPKETLEIENLADIMDGFKMVLPFSDVVASLCLHTTLGLYKKLLCPAPKVLDRWETSAQPKVVVKIESEEDMLVLQERAKSFKLPTHITIDAGRTQIAPNSRTVMAILGKILVLMLDIWIFLHVLVL